MKKYIISLMLLNILLQADFVRDNSKNVVQDTVTCLMWQDDEAAKTIKKKWQEAISYCEDLTLIGYNDWRLPNFNELYSIGEKSKEDPAIKDGFSNIVASSRYWSSTSIIGYTNFAWYVDFGDGFNSGFDKDSSYYIRCVRNIEN